MGSGSSPLKESFGASQGWIYDGLIESPGLNSGEGLTETQRLPLLPALGKAALRVRCMSGVTRARMPFPFAPRMFSCPPTPFPTSRLTPHRQKGCIRRRADRGDSGGRGPSRTAGSSSACGRAPTPWAQPPFPLSLPPLSELTSSPHPGRRSSLPSSLEANWGSQSLGVTLHHAKLADGQSRLAWAPWRNAPGGMGGSLSREASASAPLADSSIFCGQWSVGVTLSGGRGQRDPLEHAEGAEVPIFTGPPGHRHRPRPVLRRCPLVGHAGALCKSKFRSIFRMVRLPKGLAPDDVHGRARGCSLRVILNASSNCDLANSPKAC